LKPLKYFVIVITAVKNPLNLFRRRGFKNNEVNLSINALICIYNPNVKKDPYFSITSVSKELFDFNFSEPFNLEMKLNVESAGITG